MKFIRTILIAITFIVLIAYFAYRKWEADWCRGMIPASLEIERAVQIDGQSGWCGVAIFQLSTPVVAKIRATGLGALVSSSQARDHVGKRYDTYTEWRETPYVETGDGLTLIDRWLGGMTCATIDRDLNLSIDKALRSHGSYYATIGEAGLIVIPSLGLVVFSYFY